MGSDFLNNTIDCLANVTGQILVKRHVISLAAFAVFKSKHQAPGHFQSEPCTLNVICCRSDLDDVTAAKKVLAFAESIFIGDCPTRSTMSRWRPSSGCCARR